MTDQPTVNAANTRGRVLVLLRRGDQTVDAIAQALSLSPNAVRLHLSALQHDGLAEVAGVRRDGPGKPAFVYRLPASADLMLSRAHAPVLHALLDELRDRMNGREFTSLMRATGKRAAAGAPRPSGNLEARGQAALRVLTALGAQARISVVADTVMIEGDGCVLGSIVAHHPHACTAIAAMIGEIAGAPVSVACEREPGPPRCKFTLSA